MSEERHSTGENLEQAIDEATAAVSVQTGQLQELEEGPTGAPIGLDSLMNVPVKLTVQVGRTRLTLAQLVAMGPGSLIPLDREAHEPADILVNGKVVARGEIVTIDDRYGVRIASVVADPQP
ncbi:MAG: flagellar motor switch protein FliN [Planctomycetes bacterium]|nr:flagellar motor switch protein FliN [Planctomycetota bacterium]MCB9905062.1 flagellar motor switch protein FliN [Planctomycetota bacterium]